jgi:UDP-2,4-diacetamido-2,4,6-trideoxy-beta-L-altropyranose hydrolase
MDKKYKALFRVDSSTQIGTGHLMRCLVLAGELRPKGAQIFFICRELPGNLCDLVEEKGYPVYRLPCSGEQAAFNGEHTKHARWLGASWETDAEQVKNILINDKQDIDWLIVDHYAIDKRWESCLRPVCKKIGPESRKRKIIPTFQQGGDLNQLNY